MHQRLNLFLAERALYKFMCSFVLLVFLTANSGCLSLISKDSSDSKSTYKTLAITKATAETIAKTAKIMHNKGNISDEDILKIKELYTMSRNANDAVIDALLIALDSGIIPHTSPDYLNAILQLDSLLSDLLKLSKEFKIKY